MLRLGLVAHRAGFRARGDLEKLILKTEKDMWDWRRIVSCDERWCVRCWIFGYLLPTTRSFPGL
jgi:hypothetical protein